jgi:hypothetical protein
MDNEDMDYFPRAGKRAERSDAAKGEYTKQQNLAKLREPTREGGAALKFHEVNNGDVCVFRASGRPTVDFHTRKNRWQVRGHKKTTHGTVTEFIEFIMQFHDLDDAIPLAQPRKINWGA